MTIYVVFELEIKTEVSDFGYQHKHKIIKKVHARKSKLMAIKLANTLDEKPDTDTEIREAEFYYE